MIDTYDHWVANKKNRGKKCTIVWYVNDNKASHVNPRVIDEISINFESTFWVSSNIEGKEIILAGYELINHKRK